MTVASSASDAILLRLKWRLAFGEWEAKLANWVEAAKAGFDPNQSRVPAGNPDGGQWTSTGGSSGGTGHVLSDATPDNFRKPGTRVAQAGRPRSGSAIRFGGQSYDATPGQAARYSAADVRAAAALRRVREIDPKWKPRPSLAPPRSAEGAIAIRQPEAREAEARLREFARRGLGAGPFAKDSIPARSSGRRFRVDERREINRIGSETGCHTCGARDPGTPSGNFVPDHQYPSAINQPGRTQRLYPQCLTCSFKQGGFIRPRKKK